MSTELLVKHSHHGPFVWDGESPLPLGRPFAWILETHQSIIRARNLSNGEVVTIPLNKTSKLGKNQSLTVTQIKRSKALHYHKSENASQFRIIEVYGSQILQSAISKHFKGPFKIENQTITVLEEGVTLQGKNLQKGQTLVAECGMVLKLGNVAFTIQGMSEEIHIDEKVNTEKDNHFLRLIGISATAAVAVILTGVLWPQSQNEEEIIPAQFAKVIMQSPSAQQRKRQKTVAKAQKLKSSGITKLLKSSSILGSIRKQRLSEFLSKGTNVKMDGKVTMAAVGTSGEYGISQKAKIDGQGGGWVEINYMETQVQQGLTKDQVGKVIHEHLGEIRYCYESSMIKNPDIEGKLLVDFSIAGNGHVKSANIKKSTIDDPWLNKCIVGKLRKWNFPKPRGGVSVAVSYPFIFKSLGR